MTLLQLIGIQAGGPGSGPHTKAALQNLSRLAELHDRVKDHPYRRVMGDTTSEAMEHGFDRALQKLHTAVTSHIATFRDASTRATREGLKEASDIMDSPKKPDFVEQDTALRALHKAISGLHTSYGVSWTSKVT